MVALDAERLERFWGKIERTDGCWPWKAMAKDYDGYGLFSFSVEGRKYTYRAHRLAYELGHGESPGNMLVCHRCDNPPCCNPAHLFLGTYKDNFHDCLRKGRYSPKGEGNAQAKITQAAAEEIRRLYAEGGISQERLGKVFGIGQTAVSSIVRGKHWRAA